MKKKVDEALYILKYLKQRADYLEMFCEGLEKGAGKVRSFDPEKVSNEIIKAIENAKVIIKDKEE